MCKSVACVCIVFSDALAPKFAEKFQMKMHFATDFSTGNNNGNFFIFGVTWPFEKKVGNTQQWLWMSRRVWETQGETRVKDTHLVGLPDAKCSMRQRERKRGRGSVRERGDTRRDSSGLKMKINNAICHVASLLAQLEQQKNKHIVKIKTKVEVKLANQPRPPPTDALPDAVLVPLSSSFERDCIRRK